MGKKINGLKKSEFVKLFILAEKSMPRKENGKYIDSPKLFKIFENWIPGRLPNKLSVLNNKKLFPAKIGEKTIKVIQKGIIIWFLFFI